MIHLPPSPAAPAVALAFLFSTLGLLPAQSGPTMPSAPSPIHRDDGVAGGRAPEVWAAGPDYKVSFHDGMVFYPRVGRDLPNQPLRWRTTSVRAGGGELLAAPAAAPVFAATRCEFALGPVTERYDLRDEGLEQSFVVHERPPAGDLEIIGEVTTPLALAPTAARHGALSFALPDGRAVIGYGAAIAIDALGRRTPVTTESDGSRIVLRVAAATVAEAAFPLVVDPLIGNTLTALAGVTDDIDVLQETLTDPLLNANVWIAFSYEFAAGDNDIRLWRYGPGYANPQEVFRDISNWDATHGRLALAPAASRVVLAFAMASGGNSWIAVHSHHTTDFGLSTGAVFVPQGAAGIGDWRPDVGGRLEPNGSRVLITFQRELGSPFANTAASTVYATVFDATVLPMAAAFVVAPFAVLVRPNADQERPVVNQASHANRWMVAFQELNNNVSNDDWEITTVAIDGNGTATPTGLGVAEAVDPLLHAITPEIAGAHDRYVLAYGVRDFQLADPKPLAARVRQVKVQRLDWNQAAGTGSLPHADVSLISGANNNLKVGGLGFDTVSDSHWCLGIGNAGTDNYRVVKLGYTGNATESQVISLAATRTPAAIAVTFASESRSFPIVYSEEDPAGASLHYGTAMVYQNALPPTLVNFACGSGVWTGLAATANRQQIGSERMPLRLTNAPANSFAFLVISTAVANTPGAQFGAPGCTLVPDVFTSALLGTMTTGIVGGDATLTLDLPEFVPPLDLALQWVYVVPGANALGMLASEGLRIQVRR